ncbi:MAG: histidine phosphatase family protein [Chthoniobacterales bacterium]|nr:histidine phosphatase family protein [Chthoniobacterales bacterium]
MKTLYLIRHGETDHNAGDLAMGQTDVPLNERGHGQARQTAEWLRRYPVGRIVSSDLQRAMDTAAPLGAALGLAVEPDPRLRELCFGIFEGKRIDDCAREHPALVEQWKGGSFDFAPPGGETRRSLMARTLAVLDELLAAPQDHIAVFTHGGTLTALHTHMLEQDHPHPRERIHRAFRFQNGSVSMAVRAGNHWRFLVVNSTFHLAGEPRQLLY